MAATKLEQGPNLGAKDKLAGKSAKKPPKSGAGPRESILTGLHQKLGLQRTFFLSGLLFLVPIAVLLYFLATSIQGQISFSSKERLGLPYIQPLTKLATVLPKYSALLSATARTPDASQAALQTTARSVDDLMNEIQAAIDQSGTELGVQNRWAELKKKWQEFRGEAAAHTPERIHRDGETLSALTLALLVDVADQSNLTLDPDIDTYYLQNILMNGLPATASEISQLLADTSAYGNSRQLPPQLKAAIENNDIRIKLSQLRDSLNRAFTFNSTIKSHLAPQLETLEARVASALEALSAGTRQDTGPALSPSEILSLEEKIAADVLNLAGSAGADLGGLIDQRVRQLSSDLYTNGAISLSLALLAFAVLTFLSRASTATAEARDEQAARIAAENQRNQDAILRLLDEMAELADGNLTVQAEVTADFTGAIADSVNYTVGELRNLVSRVNTVSTEVADKTGQVAEIAWALMRAADQQGKEIQEANDRVEQVAASAVKVSSTAMESESVARRSLKAADKGAEAVESSIKGMNDIRDQIQETAKRIKRLGESSQEIGEIIDLITDITEQTNVLALNAAIQAAAAGEAGRSFAVVAEEVQRLAERSGEATQQIGTLIRTIQRDTQEAVAAMERSTHGVVEGAKLSDATGAALTEIRNVSKSMATLIEQIQKEASEQAGSATEMTRKMDNILMVTLQTSKGTKLASESVADLTKVANSLKASVAGFQI